MKFIYGKSVFITGGSSGIGAATVELFAENGYIVYAGSRTPSNEIKKYDNGGEIRPVILDVRDKHSVDAAVDHVLAQADVGIVIHCAGVGIACAGEDYPEESIKNLTETNYNGVLLVNNKVLPHLRNRSNGLCIIVGSVGGIFPIPFQSHYCASKAALDIYARTLRMELQSFGVQVSLVMPGDTNTDFTGTRKYEIDESSPYYKSCMRAVKKMEEDEQNGKPPITSAKVIFDLCKKKKPPARIIVGFDYKIMVLLQRILPDRLIELLLKTVYLK